jgi:hypothetical protein
MDQDYFWWEKNHWRWLYDAFIIHCVAWIVAENMLNFSDLCFWCWETKAAFSYVKELCGRGSPGDLAGHSFLVFRTKGRLFVIIFIGRAQVGTETCGGLLYSLVDPRGHYTVHVCQGLGFVDACWPSMSIASDQSSIGSQLQLSEQSIHNPKHIESHASFKLEAYCLRKTTKLYKAGRGSVLQQHILKG